MITSEIGQAVNSAAGFQDNPFIMLTFIAAPAVLTNASALLAMSTSNRFARAVDRAREIAKQIDNVTDILPSKLERLVNEFTITETRGLLLLKALRCFYLSLSSFAMVALVSLLGSAMSIFSSHTAQTVFLVTVLLLGVIAVGGLVYGVVLLLRETRMVITIMQKRISGIRESIGLK
ncbi:MAG: DUF2721 domain-containing protein [Spirochaetes bacterium]|nr:DUF2721 domain-containing protein [Spirochaetota bacterium]